jgi:CPA2 family monovalent cation:H+ antiporter-2
MSAAAARYSLLAVAVLLAALFGYAVVRGARRLVISLVSRAMPPAGAGMPDTAEAPRRAMILTLQTGIILVIGVPLLAVFQPFLPGLPSAAVLFGILLLLGVSFWRGTSDLQEHVKAVSEVVAESLAKQLKQKGPRKRTRRCAAYGSSTRGWGTSSRSGSSRAPAASGKASGSSRSGA